MLLVAQDVSKRHRQTHHRTHDRHGQSVRLSPLTSPAAPVMAYRLVQTRSCRARTSASTSLRARLPRERAPRTSAEARAVRNLTLTRTHLTSQGCRASSCSISPVDRTTLEAVLRALLSTCCMNGQRQRVSQRAEGLSRWRGARCGVLTFTSHARGASGAPMNHQTRSGSRQEPGAGPFHSALEAKGGKGGKGRSEKRRSCGICYGKVIASQPRRAAAESAS